MSYYSYIRTKSPISEDYFKADERIVFDNDQMTLYINEDNIKLNLSKLDEEKADYPYSYTFDYSEFYLFDEIKSCHYQSLINETLKLFENLKLVNNEVILETIWEGSLSKNPHKSSKQIIDYALLNVNVVDAFYSLEDFDYRSLKVNY